MRVLVTGASGFVGGSLVRRLVEKGHSVTALVRKSSDRRALERLGVRLVFGDLTTGEGLETAVRDVQCVHHVAGVLKARAPEEFARGNVEGTRLLCQAMLSEGSQARLVYCSSLAAAGPTVAGRPLRESDEPAPVSTYGRSKLAAERVVRQYSERLPSVIVRPPIVYGPGDRENIPSFLPMARLGVFFKPSFGPKEYSLIHIEDLCSALLAVSENGATVRGDDPAAGIYFVSDGARYAWREFCDTLARSVGRPRAWTIPLPNAATFAVGLASELLGKLRGSVPIMNLDKAREMREEAWTCSSERARAELSFQPRFGLAEGLAHTIAWYRQEGFLS